MELIYFLLGIIFVEVIIPILEGLLSILLSACEAKKTKYNEIIINSNTKIEQAQSSGDLPKYQIGFAIPAEKEEDDEDEL